MTHEHSVTASNLTVGYGNRAIITSLDVNFPKNEVTTIIGPNGCGKSTLLRSLSRLLPIATGEVRLNGLNINTIKRKELSRIISLLPQSPIAPEGLNVADLVARGRHPHQSFIRQWSSTDESEVFKALEMTDSLELAERTLDSLSGGQRQRVWISMVLAQNTEIILLDEPTTYLDLATSVDILELVQLLRRDLNRTVIMVLHDLNLAMRYSDNLVVMKEGQVIATGSPSQVINPELLLKAFNLNAIVINDPITGGPLVVPR